MSRLTASNELFCHKPGIPWITIKKTPPSLFFPHKAHWQGRHDGFTLAPRAVTLEGPHSLPSLFPTLTKSKPNIRVNTWMHLPGEERDRAETAPKRPFLPPFKGHGAGGGALCKPLPCTWLPICISLPPARPRAAPATWRSRLADGSSFTSVTNRHGTFRCTAPRRLMAPAARSRRRPSAQPQLRLRRPAPALRHGKWSPAPPARQEPRDAPVRRGRRAGARAPLSSSPQPGGGSAALRRPARPRAWGSSAFHSGGCPGLAAFPQAGFAAFRGAPRPGLGHGCPVPRLRGPLCAWLCPLLSGQLPPVVTQALCLGVQPSKLGWLEPGWTPGAHQSRSIAPRLSWAGERRCEERLVGREEDRETALTHYRHGQNRLDSGK